jgi:hypothetical protein
LKQEEQEPDYLRCKHTISVPAPNSNDFACDIPCKSTDDVKFGMQPVQFSLPQSPLLERLQQAQLAAIATSAKTNKGMLLKYRNPSSSD